MQVEKATLDDLLRAVLSKLLRTRSRIRPTKGSATEVTGVLLKLAKPRARLSHSETKGTVFSCLGEFLWYLAKSNKLDFISYYLKHYKKFSDDGQTIHGAYGPRLFAMRGENQIANVIARLRRKPSSRQAVVQLFDAKDIVREYKDVPCTCTLQFMIRKGRLHMFVYMRSNDAFIGLPHDVFSFTMIQEIVARSLDVDVGTYNHAVGSLHLYKVHRDAARRYLREGWQPTKPMPPMPVGNPWKAISQLVAAERVIRFGGWIDIDALRLADYWKDLLRLLKVFSHYKLRQSGEIGRLKSNMSVRIYDSYIEDKRRGAER